MRQSRMKNEQGAARAEGRSAMRDRVRALNGTQGYPGAHKQRRPFGAAAL